MKAIFYTAFRAAFANTNSGGKLYVCATPQNDDLDLAAFAALTWVQVKGLGSHGETGTNTNMLSYDTWDTEFVQKAKGTSNAGDPEIELARIPADAGQILLRSMGDHFNKNNYAFKIEKNDAPPGSGSTPSIIYNRGLVAGPRTPHGRNEDFDLEMYTLGLQQQQIIVEAAED